MITGKAEVVKWSITEVQSKILNSCYIVTPHVNTAKNHCHVSDVVNTFAQSNHKGLYFLLIFNTSITAFKT